MHNKIGFHCINQDMLNQFRIRATLSLKTTHLVALYVCFTAHGNTL